MPHRVRSRQLQPAAPAGGREPQGAAPRLEGVRRHRRCPGDGTGPEEAGKDQLGRGGAGAGGGPSLRPHRRRDTRGRRLLAASRPDVRGGGRPLPHGAGRPGPGVYVGRPARELASVRLHQLRRRTRRLGVVVGTAAAVLRPQPAVGDAVAHAAEARRPHAHGPQAAGKVFRPRSRGSGVDAPSAGRGRRDTVVRPRPRPARFTQGDRARVGGAGGRDADPALACCQFRREAAELGRPGHRPRPQRQGQPPEHAGLRHAARRRRPGGGRSGLHSRTRQRRAVDGDDGTRGDRPRPRSSPARSGALVGVPLPGHGREGRRRGLRGERLERGHRALVLREPLRPRGGQAAAPRIGVQRPRCLQARGRGPPQGHPPQRHRSRHRPPPGGNEGRSAPEGQPGRRARQAHRRARRVEQRGVGAHAARGGAAGALPGLGQGGGPGARGLWRVPRRRVPAPRLPRRREPGRRVDRRGRGPQGRGGGAVPLRRADESQGRAMDLFENAAVRRAGRDCRAPTG